MNNLKLFAIPGFEGLYSISVDGTIYSHLRGITLKQATNKAGYKRVNIRKDGKGYNFFVHQLVAKTFLANPESKPSVNHINHIKSDNNVSNLEWCTHKENIDCAVKFYRGTSRKSSTGYTHLSKTSVIEILESLENNSYLARKYGVTRSCISKLKNKHKWSSL